MAPAQEVQLQIRAGITEQESYRDEGSRDDDDGPKGGATGRSRRRRSVWWWTTVALDMLMVICGQTVATLLGRLYYNSGGNSKWMVTLAVSGGAPLLAVPLLLTLPSPPDTEEDQPAASKMLLIYAGLGLLIGLDNLMYSYALQYLPVSTYSLLAATQLAFNAVTSRLINAQRFTALIANSVVVLTFSAALLGIGGSTSDDTTTATSTKYAAGFALTVAASAAFALILSLFELTFETVIRSRALRWVLKMQLYTNLFASAVCVVGMFASGEWRAVPSEAAAFEGGKARYVATVAGIAAAWQAAAVGTVRLVSRVSALFANVTATVGLPLVPVLAVAMFGDAMSGVKAVAMLMAIWGFLSYVYQHYLDGKKRDDKCRVCAARAGSGTTGSSPA